MTSVRLEHINKWFGETAALVDVNLQVQGGELFFLLGPSGCGKSTLLRLIAGLQAPSLGSIFFNDVDVTRLGTEKRNAVMCFQSYALWPHMSVRENVLFGPKVRGMDSAKRRARVDEVLGLVKLAELADRRPNQLSGGQQQRVALARALAVEPACLLLDEPLSNLDAKLRQEMRSEIRRICKSTGVTTIYVTHDQKEALSVADRIAVLNGGQIAQIGTPTELYHRPNSIFVADFIGQTNLIPGRVLSQTDHTAHVDTAAGEITAIKGQPFLPKKVTISLRPEKIRIAGEARKPGNRVTGNIVETTFLGESSEHVLEVNKLRLKIISAPPMLNVPPQLTVEFDTQDALAFASNAECRMPNEG